MKNLINCLKLIALLSITTLIFFIKNLLVLLLIFFGLILCLILLVKNQLLKKKFISLIPIGIMIILFQTIFNLTHQPLLDKLIYGSIIFLRIAIISTSVFLWTTLTSPSEIINLLSFLPKNVRLLLTMTFYFIPSILQESTNINNIQKSRGLNSFWANPFPLIVPLLHRVMKRAEALSLTIASRGYENY